ncbi:hypothetical protein [Streptomonospora litoralis]|uniref:Uncharacterized protein n=1 Tax=Streptomonospora litoralis TaxID=2498135 RepID=A0A4V0ZKF3_9ACTN|nr:hypothetical protein [Streptomonospora litoralis]QBI56782.1 hypothetical protein EKD16_25205 [Streptomonospora litoralis]
MADETRAATRIEALANARRLLIWAEGETDLAKMERFTELGNSWMGMAEIIQDGDGPV